MQRPVYLASAVIVLAMTFVALIATTHAGTSPSFPEAERVERNQEQPATPSLTPAVTPHPDVDIAQRDDPVPEETGTGKVQGQSAERTDPDAPQFGDPIEPDPEYDPDVAPPPGLSGPDGGATRMAQGQGEEESASALEPPPAPAGLRKVTASYNSIRIGWNHVSGVAEYYIAYRRVGSNPVSYNPNPPKR